MSLKSPNIKTWMVSFLKHFSWMFAKVFISGKLFAEVLILCKILKRGFPQGIILLFSFIFLLMPPINHEHLQRCQRAACLCNCKWQAMNNAHGSCREALTPAACCRWGLACPPSDDPLPWAWFLPGVGELCAGQSPGIPPAVGLGSQYMVSWEQHTTRGSGGPRGGCHSQKSEARKLQRRQAEYSNSLDRTKTLLGDSSGSLPLPK